MAKRNFSVERVLKKEAKNREYQDPEGDRQEFEQKLREKRSEAGRLAINLGFQLYCPAVDGAIKVANGDPDGWGLLHIAHQYDVWQLAVRFVRFDYAKVKPGQQDKAGKWWFLGNDLANAAYHLAYSLLVGWDQVAELLGSRMLTCVLECNELFVDDTWTWSDSFPTFMLRLYAMSIGEEVPSPHAAAEQGPYRPIFDHWNDEDGLASAIEAICAVHCDQYLNEVGVFSHFPKSVIPAEVLALHQIRTQLGLTTPDIDHPLLDSPFADVPIATNAPDDLLKRTMTRCAELLPGVEPLW